MFNFVHPAVGSKPLRWKGWREDLRSVVMKPTISGAPDLPLPVRAIPEAGGIKIQVVLVVGEVFAWTSKLIKKICSALPFPFFKKGCWSIASLDLS